ncbi:MAG: 4Fe-4S dicluster domain-containing protein [Bacteroidota bacterium]
MQPTATQSTKYILERQQFDTLISTLQKNCYSTIGPTVCDNAIVYGEIMKTNDLPIGWTDEQERGTYRLKKRNDNALFGYVVGPQSWKKFLFPSSLKIFSATLNEKGFQVTNEVPKETKYAFIGMRACELYAIAIQDKIFLNGQFIEPQYKQLREDAFFIAVNCGQAANTCFCDSMQTGPQADKYFDIALTEICNEKEHYFIIESGSEKAKKILSELSLTSAEKKHDDIIAESTNTAVKQMKRNLDTTNTKRILYEQFDNPHWDEIATRCLNCANCTMVCPTCFCTTVEDVTDLTGDNAERWRKWDSCFTMDYSYIHGGSLRASGKSRYRQWMTHKLSSWYDQFGTSGCVGCGRCITWCPVGIDITEEAKVFQQAKKITK